MSYTGQNPRFRSTILTDVGLASIGNPASGSHRIINRGGTLQVQDDTGLETAIGAGGTVDRITQVGHGFDEGDILYNTGSAYAKANANTSATAEALGMVSRVIDVDIFELTLEGKVTGLTGLTAGAVYFLSASTAGAITVTEPSTLGYVSLPIGVAISTTDFYVKSSRGAVVGSVNARTEIALADNATTNVQSVSAYQAGELTGWVEIDGTTDSKFYVAAPFAIKGDGSDYNISPQYVGDTPPVGFSITVTSGGLIQATLPSITGYVSAKINFALNAPAVGATFPLSIDSTLVQFSTLKAKDSGGFVFQENGGTQIGSISDAGAWSLGTASTINTHTINVGASSRAIKFGPGDGNIRPGLTVDNAGGSIAVALATGAGNPQLNFAGGSLVFNNGTYATVSDATNMGTAGATSVGQVSTAGAWTLGSSAKNATHIMQGEILSLDSASGNNTALKFAYSGTNKYSLYYYNVDGSWRIADGGGTDFAQCSSAGAWTLGPSTGLTAGHNIRNSSNTTAALTVTNTNTGSNSDGIKINAGGTADATAVVLGCFDASGSTIHFIVRPNGKLYVRTDNWGTGGTAIGVSGNDLTTSPSSRRYKENERSLGIDSSKIYQIEVKEFDYIESKGGSHDFGAIAEDVDVIFPEIVWKENGQAESIRESKMVWLLLEEMKKLKSELDTAKARITTLEGN